MTAAEADILGARGGEGAAMGATVSRCGLIRARAPEGCPGFRADIDIAGRPFPHVAHAAHAKAGRATSGRAVWIDDFAAWKGEALWALAGTLPLELGAEASSPFHAELTRAVSGDTHQCWLRTAWVSLHVDLEGTERDALQPGLELGLPSELARLGASAEAALGNAGARRCW